MSLVATQGGAGGEGRGRGGAVNCVFDVGYKKVERAWTRVREFACT